MGNEFGKKLILILDIRIRWNSLADMLERFLTLKNAIVKTAQQLNLDLNLTNTDFEALKDIVQTLIPIKIGSEKLCKRDTSLLDSKTVFNFIINELNEQKSVFSLAMKNSLIQRINERRCREIVGLMKYLTLGVEYTEGSGELLKLPSKKMLQKEAKHILTRFEKKADEKNSNENNPERTKLQVTRDQPL